MRAPERFAGHLREHGCHPRSNAHGNALCQYVLEELLDLCPPIAVNAAAASLVYELNRKIVVGTSEWNVDLLLGPPPGVPQPVETPARIRRAPPAAIRIAIEAKTIMTEHGKARRNRQRDLDSFHHSSLPVPRCGRRSPYITTSASWSRRVWTSSARCQPDRQGTKGPVLRRTGRS
jgi:hypothetical protein